MQEILSAVVLKAFMPQDEPKRVGMGAESVGTSCQFQRASHSVSIF